MIRLSHHKTNFLLFVGFNTDKAESIFAKYRNQQNQSPSSDAPEVPSAETGTLSERPAEVLSSRPPKAPSSRRRKHHISCRSFLT